MKTLIQRYCRLHQQAFVPIFVSDSFDAVQLAESCVAAGADAIEILIFTEKDYGQTNSNAQQERNSN